MPVGLYHMYPLGQKDGINMTESAAQPLYKYIKDDIVRQIKDGIYKPDQCLPSERDFCLIYGTTRMTVRHALNDLEVEGVVYRLQGKGTFVTGAKLVQPLILDCGLYLCHVPGFKINFLIRRILNEKDHRNASCSLHGICPLRLRPDRRTRC